MAALMPKRKAAVPDAQRRAVVAACVVVNVDGSTSQQGGPSTVSPACLPGWSSLLSGLPQEPDDDDDHEGWVERLFGNERERQGCTSPLHPSLLSGGSHPPSMPNGGGARAPVGPVGGASRSRPSGCMPPRPAGGCTVPPGAPGQLGGGGSAQQQSPRAELSISDAGSVAALINRSHRPMVGAPGPPCFGSELTSGDTCSADAAAATAAIISANLAASASAMAGHPSTRTLPYHPHLPPFAETKAASHLSPTLQ